MKKEISLLDFIWLESISSTNTWAKQHASTFDPSHLTCIIAKEQTAGRGRGSKKWVSPKDNFYCSFYFVIPKRSSYIVNLGQITALSCAELLQKMGVSVVIKWPNDLLVSDGQAEMKKMGGVLTETISTGQKIGVIIGLGLNVNMPKKFLKIIDQPATSLHLILHKKIKPYSLLKPLLKLFLANLQKLQSIGFAPFQSRFQKLLAYKGKTMTVQLPHKKVKGICDSITQDGRLKLRLPSGRYLTLSTGEMYLTRVLDQKSYKKAHFFDEIFRKICEVDS